MVVVQKTVLFCEKNQYLSFDRIKLYVLERNKTIISTRKQFVYMDMVRALIANDWQLSINVKLVTKIARLAIH